MRRVSSLRFELVTALLLYSAGAAAQDAAAQDAASQGAVPQDREPSPTDIKQAARAFDNARNAFGAEDYQTAAEEFETADGYAPSPVALQWAIDAQHRHPEVAELVELAGRVISETEGTLLEVQVVCEEPCELFVDKKMIHGQPANTRTLFLNPGQYTVT